MEQYFNEKWKALERRLCQVVRERMGSFGLFGCPYDTSDQKNGAKISILNDIVNLRADASLFDHLEQ